MLWFLSWRLWRSPYHLPIIRQTMRNAFGSIVFSAALAVLCIVLYQGFWQKTLNSILKFQPHIMLYPKSEVRTAELALAKQKDILYWENFSTEKAVLSKDNAQAGVLLRSVGKNKLKEIKKNVLRETYGTGIYLGEGLAAEYNFKPGDLVDVYLPFKADNQKFQVRIKGIVRVGIYEYDNFWAFSEEEYTIPETIEIHLRDISKLNRVKKSLVADLGNYYYVKDWTELHGNMLVVLRVLETVLLTIIISVLFMALFILKQALELIIFEKHKTIILLRSLNLSLVGIVLMFLLIAVFILVPALLLGAGLGWLLALYLPGFLVQSGLVPTVVSGYLAVYWPALLMLKLFLMALGFGGLFILPALGKVFWLNQAEALR